MYNSYCCEKNWTYYILLAIVGFIQQTERQSAKGIYSTAQFKLDIYTHVILEFLDKFLMPLHASKSLKYTLTCMSL